MKNFAFTRDLGTHGRSFPIQEEDILDHAPNFTHFSEKDHLKYIEEPKPVAGLSNATEYHVYYYDPTLTLKTDIEDCAGNIIIEKGTSYNPLNRFSLNHNFLFFDGTDDSHVEWAKQEADDSQWILVKGSPLAVEDNEQRPVFFDQQGALKEKLGLKKIPARVSQEGLRLKIEEFPVN